MHEELMRFSLVAQAEGTGSVSAQDGECADCLQSFPFLRSKKSDVVHREIADCIVNRSYHRRIDSLEAKPFSAQGSTLCFRDHANVTNRGFTSDDYVTGLWFRSLYPLCKMFIIRVRWR